MVHGYQGIKTGFFILALSIGSFSWSSQALQKKLFTKEEIAHKKSVVKLAENILKEREKWESLNAKHKQYKLNEAILLNMIESKDIIQCSLDDVEKNQSSSAQDIAALQSYALYNANIALALAPSCKNKEQQERCFQQIGHNTFLAAQLQQKYREKLDEKE